MDRIADLNYYRLIKMVRMVYIYICLYKNAYMSEYILCSVRRREIKEFIYSKRRVDLVEYHRKKNFSLL